MAQVFLTELNNTKTYGVMTTHYNSIKALAGELPRVENGSMQFNSEDLTPEYILNQGVPGSSYTYEVAQQVGISPDLIQAAREALDDNTVAVDRLLVSIQKEKNRLSAQSEALAKRLEELEKLKEKQDRKIDQLEDKVRRQSAMNEQQNAMITWGKKFQSLVNEYADQRTKKGKDEVVGRFKVYVGERAEQTQGEKQKKKSKYEKQKEKKIKKLIASPATVGDRVKLIGSRQPGEIIEIKKDQYLLSIGALSTWVTRDKFIPAESLHGDEGTVKGKARGGVREEAPATDAAAPTKSKAEETADKKNAKKSAKSGQNQPKKAENAPKTTKKPRKRTKTEKPKTTQEKLQEVQKAAPLKQAPTKKSSGKSDQKLTPEQAAQLNAPVRKVGSPKAKAEEPKEATDADLEKLKAFFKKN
jgi:DNA mismatch repair protein MutS2